MDTSGISKPKRNVFVDKNTKQPEKRKKYNIGGRANLLEELGRVDSEKAYTSKGKKNLKAEKKRIVREVSSRGAAKRGHGKEIK